MTWNKRTLRDYALPSLDMVQEAIARSTVTANNFEIKPAMIQMIQNNLQFRCTMTEDSNQYLKQFLQLYDTFKYNGVTDDTIRLRLFPFSLIDNAFSWQNNIRVLNYTLDMFGLTNMEQEEEAHEREEEREYEDDDKSEEMDDEEDD
ncbi:uncharacterized protein LOC128033971 [Gossypium raimondii]|uniref:uncharacterized protein LOC128033971 n=1 Tax=Gossypium raimondii TaxID=29730 RepID=UPI00227B3FCD|nr:uncharacterized protein LOC128033971 [Gossypium raimondii]